MIYAPTDTTRIVALTPAGKTLAYRLTDLIARTEVWYKPEPFAEKVQQAFAAGEGLVFICATGIVMRTLAPVLQSKQQDPPVLVLDEAARFVIPLLSGHQGGANQWASEIARALQAQCVLTTANAYLEPVYTVGMGCERSCPQSELEALFAHCLQLAGLRVEQIASINSIAIKADEIGLIDLAAAENKPYLTWTPAELLPMEDLLSVKSDYVLATVGVYGVAESAALLAAQQLTQQVPELMLVKQKTARATCAIARAYPIANDTRLNRRGD